MSPSKILLPFFYRLILGCFRFIHVFLFIPSYLYLWFTSFFFVRLAIHGTCTQLCFSFFSQYWLIQFCPLDLIYQPSDQGNVYIIITIISLWFPLKLHPGHLSEIRWQRIIIASMIANSHHKKKTKFGKLNFSWFLISTKILFWVRDYLT